MQNEQVDSEKRMIEKVDADRLWTSCSTLAQWVRHSGTAEEREAFHYLRDELENYGVHTAMIEHPALVSYPLQAELTCLRFAGSASVPTRRSDRRLSPFIRATSGSICSVPGGQFGMLLPGRLEVTPDLAVDHTVDLLIKINGAFESGIGAAIVITVKLL